MKISIITVTKNNKAGLLRAIESVRSQTYKNVEHIVVDGLSTDGTVEILKQVQNDILRHFDKPSTGSAQDDNTTGDNDSVILRQAQYDKGKDDSPRHFDKLSTGSAQDDSPRHFDKLSTGSAQDDTSLFTNHYSLITISEADSGIYDAINKGIRLATGDVIGLLHSDDFFADEFVLERYAEAFGQCAESGGQRPLNPPRRAGSASQRDWQGDNASVILSSSKYDRTQDDKRKDGKGLTTDNQPPTADNRRPNIDAVYSDLVYVSQKSKVKSRKLKDSGIKTLGKDFSPGKPGFEMTTPDMRQQTTNELLLTDYSVIRTWKTHSIENREQRSENSEKEIVKNMQVPKQVRDDNYSSLITDHLLLSGWMPPHPTVFIRKEIFEKYGFYRTDMKIAADYEMILRLFYKYNITTRYLPLTTYCMTIGGVSNKSLRNIFIKSSEDYRAMKMHSIPFPLKTLFLKNIRKLPQFFKENRD